VIDFDKSRRTFWLYCKTSIERRKSIDDYGNAISNVLALITTDISPEIISYNFQFFV
jgi:hypothetical protein